MLARRAVHHEVAEDEAGAGRAGGPRRCRRRRRGGRPTRSATTQSAIAGGDRVEVAGTGPGRCEPRMNQSGPLNSVTSSRKTCRLRAGARKAVLAVVRGEIVVPLPELAAEGRLHVHFGLHDVEPVVAEDLAGRLDEAGMAHQPGIDGVAQMRCPWPCAPCCRPSRGSWRAYPRRRRPAGRRADRHFGRREQVRQDQDAVAVELLELGSGEAQVASSRMRGWRQWPGQFAYIEWSTAAVWRPRAGPASARRRGGTVSPPGRSRRRIAGDAEAGGPVGRDRQGGWPVPLKRAVKVSIGAR